MNYEITPEEVKTKLESGAELTLLDCREPWEYQAARIERAVNIPMGEIPSRLQELDPDHPTACLCHHGARSMHVAAFLMNNGFETVANISGGIDAWSRERDPGVPRY